MFVIFFIIFKFIFIFIYLLHVLFVLKINGHYLKEKRQPKKAENGICFFIYILYSID